MPCRINKKLLSIYGICFCRGNEKTTKKEEDWFL